MSKPSFHLRRATLEDLELLRGLWQIALFSHSDLEKHLTEFQVIEGDDGRLLGAIGIRLRQENAWIHHAAFTRPHTGIALREILWDRLKSMFRQHGVHRVWISQSEDYWSAVGFRTPTTEERNSVPPPFETLEKTLKVFVLRDEKSQKIIERKMLELQSLREEETAQLNHRTRLARIMAWSFTGFFIVILIYLTLRSLIALPRL